MNASTRLNGREETVRTMTDLNRSRTSSSVRVVTSRSWVALEEETGARSDALYEVNVLSFVAARWLCLWELEATLSELVSNGIGARDFPDDIRMDF